MAVTWRLTRHGRRGLEKLLGHVIASASNLDFVRQDIINVEPHLACDIVAKEEPMVTTPNESPKDADAKEEVRASEADANLCEIKHWWNDQVRVRTWLEHEFAAAMNRSRRVRDELGEWHIKWLLLYYGRSPWNLRYFIELKQQAGQSTCPDAYNELQAIWTDTGLISN